MKYIRSAVIKNFLTKHIALIVVVSLIILSISSILMVYAYSRGEYTKKEYLEELASIEVSVDKIFYVKPALVYDYNTIISSEKVYYGLAREIILNISIETIVYNNTSLGKLKTMNKEVAITSIIKTSMWSKKYNLTYMIIGNKTPTYMVTVDIENVSSIINIIDSETGLRTREYSLDIYLNTIVDVIYTNGKTRRYMITPKITILFDKDTNTIEVTAKDLEKTFVNKNTIVNENKLDILDVSIRDTKRITLYTLVASATIFFPSIVYFIKTSIRPENKQDYLDRHRYNVIRGKIAGKENKILIEINDIKTFLTLAKHYRTPIIHDIEEDKIYIIIGDIIYSISRNSGSQDNKLS